VAAQFTAAIDEAGQEHSLSLTIHDPTGAPLAASPPFEIRLGHALPGWDDITVIAVLELASMTFADEGWYSFDLDLDGRDLVDLPLRVVLNPSTAQELKGVG
jgi:hypothetical protein